MREKEGGGGFNDELAMICLTETRGTLVNTKSI